MNLNLSPIQVDISIEALSLEREAFYNVCFITENNTAPRTITVNSLKELLDAGYERDSLAYNFCVAVFSQQAIPSVTIRAKRAPETYEKAFSADTNFNYYFIVIESKDLTVIKNFNDYLINADDNKLQFYSSNNPTIQGGKLVHYYHKLIQPISVSPYNEINILNSYINKAYNLGYTVTDLDKATISDLQTARLAYPEAAWIGLCGNTFPSSIQWLYKYLAKVDTVKDKQIPDLSSTSSIVIKNKATVGSGRTTQGILIHEQVSLDWVRWAIARKVWSTLYNTNKVNATQGGSEIITNDVKSVLEVAVEQGIFSIYNIADVTLDAQENKLSIRFNAMLTQSIMNVEVNGSLYY